MRSAVVPSRSSRARLRRALWRWRHLVLAGCLGLAAALAVATLAPAPPPTVEVLTLTAPTPAGRPLAAGDLTVRRLPVGSVPAEALRDPGAATGRSLAVGLPAGTAVLPGMLTGPDLADRAPPGTVVVAVPLADAGSAALARPGRRIGLVAATESGEASLLAQDVVVLAVQEPAAATSTVLGATPEQGAFAYVAARPTVATLLVGSSAWAPLRVMLQPP